MSTIVRPVAIVQRADGALIRQLLARFVGRWQGRVRIAGVLEDDTDPDRTMLRAIADGHRYPLYQDLGSGSTSCAIDAPGVVAAGEAVRQAVEAGCDIAVISKFGKLEAENRSGLLGAFAAAVAAGVPVLTSVAPKFDAAWTRFADPLFMSLPAEDAAIEAWWAQVRPHYAEAR